MASCPAGYSASNESKPTTVVDDSRVEEANYSSDPERQSSFLEEFGDKEISFGDKRGTVAEAMERCPHLKNLGETALRGVVSAVIASQEQDPDKVPEDDKPAKPLLPKSDKPKAHKQTGKSEKVSATKEAVVAASTAHDGAGEQEIEPASGVAETVREPVEDSLDGQAVDASRNETVKEAVKTQVDNSFRVDIVERSVQPTNDNQEEAPGQPPELAIEQQKTPTHAEKTIEPGTGEPLQSYAMANNQEIITDLSEGFEEKSQEAMVTVDDYPGSPEAQDDTTLSMEATDNEAVDNSSESTLDASETYGRQEQAAEVLTGESLAFDFSEDYETEEFTSEVLEVFMELAELPLESLTVEKEPHEGSEDLVSEADDTDHRQETPENTAFENFINSVPEETAPTPEDILSTADEDAPAEESLRQLAIMLSDYSGTDSLKPAMHTIEAIQRQLYENLSTQEGEAKKVTITPETMDQLMTLLRNLGYQNPKEALMELINRRGLRFVMQTVHYLYQLRDAGNRQEFKTDPMLFKPTDHTAHHPLGVHLGQLAIALASKGLQAGRLITK